MYTRVCYSRKGISRNVCTTVGADDYITLTTVSPSQTCMCPLQWLQSQFFQSLISHPALRDWQAIFRVTGLSFGKWWCQTFHWLSPFTTWSFGACVHSLWGGLSYKYLLSCFSNPFVSLMFTSNPSFIQLTWCRAVEGMETAWISRLFMTGPLVQASFLVPVQEI